MAFDGSLCERDRGVVLSGWIVVLWVVQRIMRLLLLLLQVSLLVMHQMRRMMKLLLAVEVGSQLLLRRTGGRTNSGEVCVLLPAGSLEGVGPRGQAHWWTGTISSGGLGHANRDRVPAQDPATPAARRPQSLSQIWTGPRDLDLRLEPELQYW